MQTNKLLALKMTENHSLPIAPPPELRAQWRQEAPRYRDGGVGREDWLIRTTAHWSADQELEACCEWLRQEVGKLASRKLRNARRPKPQSLKEQSIALFDLIQEAQ